jgi:hypothetical protein
MHAAYTYRNPDANERPAIQDVMMPLQKPDFQILRWESEDASSSAAEATILGAPLQDGFHLYKDLQKTYLSATGAHGELEVNVVGENVCNTSEGISESVLVGAQPRFTYHLVDSVGYVETEPRPAYMPAREVEHSSDDMNGDMLLSIQNNLAYSANDLPGSDSIETKLCALNLETNHDDDYI